MTKTRIALASAAVLGSAIFALGDETVVTSLYQPSVYTQSHRQDARGAYAEAPARAWWMQNQEPFTNRMVW